MRAIDADALLERVWSEKIQAQKHGREFSTCFMSPGGTPSTEWWFVEDLIENAPTIEPERKKGKWTKDCACEICGFKPWYERDIHTLSFCPNCGADLRGDDHDL